jgi:hypothetical protein
LYAHILRRDGGSHIGRWDGFLPEPLSRFDCS